MDLQTINIKANHQEVDQATESVENLDKQMTAVERTLERQRTKMEILRGQTIQLKDGVVELGQGFTQSQANALANLKILDATSSEMKELANSFRDLNALSGVNPFDKVSSGINKLAQDIRELKTINDLQAKGFGLTADQIKALSRDLEGLRQVHREMNSGVDELNQSIDQHIQRFVTLANVKNKYTAQAEQATRQIREEARVQAEMTAQLEKNRKLVNDEMMKGWASNVGQKSPVQQDMSAFYKQQAIEAERSIEMQKKVAAEAMAAQQKSSDDMFRNHQYKLAQDQVLYKQGMADLAAYYSNLEKLDQQAEAQRKQSFDRMIEVNRLKQEQDRREYEKLMAAMREFYNQQQKESAGTVRTGQPDMDAHVAQFRQAQARATKEAAKANEYLIDAERRLKVALDETNAEFTERYTDRINKFQKALEKSGLSADAASAKMANFRKGLEGLQAKERAEELRYLSRAMSVQMGDVAISLASGMNPLLVMIQQGDQIRGVIDQVGVSGKDLTRAMNDAAAQIARGFVDTGKAIGGFFVGAVQSAAAAVTDFLLAAYQTAISATVDFVKGTSTLTQALDGLATSARAFGKVALIAVITGLIATAKAFYDVSKEQDAMVIALNKSGAALGMSKDAAIAFTQSLEGIRTSKVTEVLTAIANTGQLTSESITLITEASVAMSKYAGVAIEDTVKNFAKLKEKPSEALAELTRGTGYLTVAVLDQIRVLEENGNKAAAAALAMEEYGKISKQVADDIKGDLSALTLGWMDLKSAISGIWQDFKEGVTQSEALGKALRGLGLFVQFAALGFKLLKEVASGATWPQLKESLAGDIKRIEDYMDGAKRGTQELTAAQKAYNAESVRQYEIQQKIARELRGTVNPSDARSMSKGDYVATKMQELIDRSGTTLDPSNMAAAIKKFEKEWDNAKEKKVQLTDAEKYYIKELERSKEAMIKASGAQQELTTAQQKMLDLLDDDNFKKLSTAKKAELLNNYALAHSEQERVRQMKEAKKFEEERVKTLNELANATERVAGAQKFYGSFLDKINEQVLEGRITDQEAAEFMNRYARNRVFAPNQEDITTRSDDQRKVFEQDRERANLAFRTSANDRESALKQYDLEIERKKEILELDKKARENLITPEFLEMQKQKINALYDEKVAWIAVEDQMKKIQSESDQLANIFTTAFSDLIKGGKSFGDVLKNLGNSVANLVMEIMILEPLKNSLRASFSSGGGLTGMFSSFLGGFFAEGGEPPVNKISVVGEKGPELFVPKTAGTIIPNDKIGLGGNSTNVTQNVVFNIQSNNGNVSRESLQQIQTAMGAATQRALRRNS